MRILSQRALLAIIPRSKELIYLCTEVRVRILAEPVKSKEEKKGVAQEAVFCLRQYGLLKKWPCDRR